MKKVKNIQPQNENSILLKRVCSNSSKDVSNQFRTENAFCLPANFCDVINDVDAIFPNRQRHKLRHDYGTRQVACCLQTSQRLETLIFCRMFMFARFKLFSSPQSSLCVWFCVLWARFVFACWTVRGPHSLFQHVNEQWHNPRPE